MWNEVMNVYYEMEFQKYSGAIYSFFNFYIVVQFQLSPFFTHYSPLSYLSPISHIQSFPPTLVFVHESFIHVPWLDLPLSFLGYLPPSFLWSLWLVLYFHDSGSILLTSLFCLGSTYRWDHMVFVFHQLTFHLA